MANNRLGTAYQTEVRVDDAAYSVRQKDDIIELLATSTRIMTLPHARNCRGDDGYKILVNSASSGVGDNMELAVQSGDTLVGLNAIAPGASAIAQSDGASRWFIAAAVENSGAANASISTADSKGESAATAASSAASLAAVADSKGVSAGVRASSAAVNAATADSKGVSAAAEAVVADSKGESAGTRGSVADSKAVIADSKGESAAVRASSAQVNAATADSKGVSGGVAASVASSMASANVVALSTLTSRVSSGE